MAANIQRWKVEKPWLETHCLLGEGPFYEKRSNTVRFVDIKKKTLHRVSLTEGPSSLTTLQLDVCPTVTADIAGVDPEDRIVLGTKYGLAVLDVKKGTYDLIQPFHETRNERVRSNDGAADPHGRFWLGAMTDFGLGDFQSEGALFRMDANSREEIISGLTIPNTPGFSPDGRTLYFTHSTARQILAMDYDGATGEVSERRVFYQHDGPGEPDGFRIDVDGNIWQCVFGESRVLKISPAGQLVGEVQLPTRNITCVQFAGTELVITTAADDEGEGASREYGGDVFRVDVGTRGLELYEFKL
ncbi:hypothetical protein B0T10DRAFT_476163 [Thelonectria olida]|uniref:SMP-30/Gluconolactonase/LRE-like region domain-containing protein n=1 Tax=Thelonectria olida TaxID=1576542 RepID=A0A9P8WGR8_9HYPO|nr:hypothetical protein B0T10DRAFT_476163 [Thelonectria olida]